MPKSPLLGRGRGRLLIIIKYMTFQDFNLSKTADGLLPVIIQDADSLKVLMLGYMNQEAFEKSQAEGRVT